MIAGVLTANELALLRTRPQRTQLYLAIPQYKTIYSARVNNAPASNDNLRNIEFDGGAGTIGNILRNMTVLVGTTAGTWDIGMARMRSTATDSGGGTGTLPVGSTSELDLSNDQYLTVIDDFGLWPVHPFISGAGVTYIDYDIPYTNQNTYGNPVPIMGSHVVVELTGASVSVHFDASDSYTCIGTPDHYDYEWYVDNVLTAATAAVDIAFTSAGTYVIRLEVTADYNIGSPIIEKTSVAVRYVIVHDTAHPLNASFVLDSCSGSFDNNGWSYRVTMNAKASETYVRDRTLCLLVAKDVYGDTEQSIGPLDESENIVCVGWVDGESLRRSNDKSMVSFDVQGPAFWLGVQEGFPTGIDDTNVVPTDWLHIKELDPRKGIFSFLHWRTNSTVVMDCYITSDDHRLATTYTPAGSLLEQLRAIAERVNAYTVCDRYGRLFCEIDTQFIDPAFRTFPVVQTMTDRDWRDEIAIERRAVPSAGQVDLSGVYYSGDLTTSQAIFSLSPGHYPRHYGEKRKIERIALDNQAEANTLAGLWMGYLNNEYPNIDTPMSSNYRAVDIAPRMFVQMNLATADTPRGISWANKKLIPSEVTFNYEAREAVLLTDVTFEAETFASVAVVGDPPIEPPDPPDPPDPPAMCNDPTALNFGGYAPCYYATAVSGVCVICNSSQLAITHTYDEASPVWYDATPSGSAGAIIFGFVIDPSGTGAWVLTGDGSNDALDGVFRCDDITADNPVFSLVYSQAQALIDGQAALSALGWVRLDFEEMGSIATGADNSLVVVERKWSGFQDRDPSCVFVTTNGGASFSCNVPSGAAAHRFWAEKFNSLYGCHQIWWDGSQYIIGGTVGWPFFNARAATATSADGSAWVITEEGASNYYYPRSYAGGYAIYDDIGGVSVNKLVQWPTTEIVTLSYSAIWYHHFDYGGTQCYIYEDVVNFATQNYLNVGGVDVVDSTDVFGTDRIGGAALRNATTYVLVPQVAKAAGMVVCERSAGVNTDKTGDLLTALGGTWAGHGASHYDNCQIEVY